MTRARVPDWPWVTVRALATSRGARVWPVGGAVRDALLGEAIHDWDFAVAGDALSLGRAVADALGGAYFTLDFDRQTGRVLASDPSGHEVELDFAALRGNTLQADLIARDFTVNALALGESGRVIDPSGGLRDLRARRLRAVTESAFCDDPVRMLRAIRLESQLGFELETQTRQSIVQNARLLSSVSPERLRDELVRMLQLDGSSRFFRQMEDLGLLPSVLPEVADLRGVPSTSLACANAWEQTLLALDLVDAVAAAATESLPANAATSMAATEQVEDIARELGDYARGIADHLSAKVGFGRDRLLLLRLSALFHDVGRTRAGLTDRRGACRRDGCADEAARLCEYRLRDLRFSRAETTWTRAVVRYHLVPQQLAEAAGPDPREVYRFFRRAGEAGVEACLLSLALDVSSGESRRGGRTWARELEVVSTLLGHFFDHHNETISPPRLVTGEDLMHELGLTPGPLIGRLLRAIEESTAAGEVRNAGEALALASRMVSSVE